MRLRFTPRATANIIEIADYIHARNPAVAERVRAAIYASVQNLLLFPQWVDDRKRKACASL